MKCPNCNAEVSDDATFCPKCGAKLDGTEMPEENNASSENGNSFHLSKKIITIAVIVIALIILALSCPNKQTHVEALNNAIMTYLTESMSKDSTMTKDGSDEFATGLASSIVLKVLNSKLNVNNYFDNQKNICKSRQIVLSFYKIGCTSTIKRSKLIL